MSELTGEKSEEVISNKYDQLWEDGYSLNISPEAAVEFFHFSRPVGGMKVLDVGCGSAVFFESNQDWPMEVWGIDCSRVAIVKAKERVPGGEFLVGWGERLPFGSSSFDRVYCLGSLEHFVDMALGLKEMRRVLKVGGLILLQVPIGDTESGGEQPIRRVMAKDDWRSLYAKAGLTVLDSREAHGCDWSLCM